MQMWHWSDRGSKLTHSFPLNQKACLLTAPGVGGTAAVAAGVPVMPGGLTEIEQAAWVEIAELLEPRGVLAPCDAAVRVLGEPGKSPASRSNVDAPPAPAVGSAFREFAARRRDT